MSNDQSYLDDGQPRDVQIICFDEDGNMSDKDIVIGQASTYAEALSMAQSTYTVAPENAGYDFGHVASAEGRDAYGIPVLVTSEG